MRLLRKFVHEEVKNLEKNRIYERVAARGIILKDEKILMIYTKRYNDYSFPGGGVNKNEDIKIGLMRELKEETGAQNIKLIDNFGKYEELRPTYYDDYDSMHMISYFYLCYSDKELGEASPEDYELQNGSEPVWVNIYDAINHNKSVINNKEKSMGLSIERETFVLELIAKELLEV